MSTGILRCTRCNHLSGDVSTNPKAWSGWTIAPKEKILCPSCIDKDLAAKGFEIRLGHEGGKYFSYLYYRGA